MSKDEPEPKGEDSTAITRRRIIASGAATWATVSLAGCERIADPGPPDQGDGDDGGDDNEEVPSGNGNTTVSNETTATDDPEDEETTECASIRRFASGMEIGLHVDIFDEDTGTHLGDNAIDSVTVEFPDADFEPLDLNWNGAHEVYSETTWGGKVVTSEDLESGTYRYEITVDGDDVDSETIVDEFTIV